MGTGFLRLVPLAAAALLCGASASGAGSLAKPGTYPAEDVSILIQSPHGYDLRVRWVRPRLSAYPGKRFPAILRIGGGWGNSTFLLENKLAKKAASAGIMVVAFDSELKAREKPGSPLLDYNGFRDQDDAAAILKLIIEHPNVDKDRIGVWSHSNGITLAAGMLGREKYHDLSEKILFLLDDEGPHCPSALLSDPDIRFHTAGIRDMWAAVMTAKVGPGRAYATETDFFRERCASNFIGSFGGIYQRVQARDDHETARYHGHAAAMINTATRGRAKWTRLNRQPRGRHYVLPGQDGGVDIDSVLDIERLSGPNDRRIWDVAAELLE